MADEKIVVVCDDNCGKCKIAFWDEEFCYYICGLRKFIKTGDTATIEINQNKDLTK
jgi:hypothetical protein